MIKLVDAGGGERHDRHAGAHGHAREACAPLPGQGVGVARELERVVDAARIHDDDLACLEQIDGVVGRAWDRAEAAEEVADARDAEEVSLREETRETAGVDEQERGEREGVDTQEGVVADEERAAFAGHVLVAVQRGVELFGEALREPATGLGLREQPACGGERDHGDLLTSDRLGVA